MGIMLMGAKIGGSAGVDLSMLTHFGKGKGKGRGKSKCKPPSCKPPPCHHHHHAQPPQFSSTIKYEGKITFGG